jgi:hypothetical protein
MKRTAQTVLRAALCGAVLLAPTLSAAQSMSVTAAAEAGVSGVPGAAAAAGTVRAGALPAALAPSALLAPSPILSAPSSLSAPPAAPVAAPAAAPALSAAPAARAAAADGPTPLQEPLQPGERWHGDPRLGEGDILVPSGPRGRELAPLSSFEAPAEPVGWRSERSRLDKTFDGSSAERRALGDDLPVAGTENASPSPLRAPAGRTTAAAREVPPSAVAAPAKARNRTKLALTAAVALALLMTPATAFAAPAVFSAATSMSWLAALHPLASVAGAVAGAVYGMFAAKPADGSSASSAEVLSSILRYGALGGAAVYMLFDAATVAFMGSATGGGLMPLSTAVVTAALGRSAFQGAFTDTRTSSADRIAGAFPAVAAALGLSIGLTALGFVAPPLASSIAFTSMAVTGAAAAVYSALFRYGRSPHDGPARMAKGWVLQSLMLGLALAVSNPWLFGLFALMGASGSAMVIYTLARELWSFLPGQAVPAPPPSENTVPTSPSKPGTTPTKPGAPQGPGGGIVPQKPGPLSADDTTGGSK